MNRMFTEADLDLLRRTTDWLSALSRTEIASVDSAAGGRPLAERQAWKNQAAMLTNVFPGIPRYSPPVPTPRECPRPYVWAVVAAPSRWAGDAERR